MGFLLYLMFMIPAVIAWGLKKHTLGWILWLLACVVWVASIALRLAL